MGQNDGVTVTVERRIEPAALAVEKDALLRSLSTAAGFRNVRVVRHRDDPARLLFIEDWEDEQAREAHLASGAAHGLLRPDTAAETNVWPTLVVTGGAAETAHGPDGVTITFELKLVPPAVEPFTKGANFQGASTFAGFRTIRMVQHRDDPARLLFIERWDSEPAYMAYVNFRAERGEMDGLRKIAPVMKTDVWPHFVAEAGPALRPSTPGTSAKRER